MSDTLIVLITLVICVVVVWGSNRLDRAIQRSNDRLDQIERDMYYEQADRDGVEYPPQWRGR